MSLKNKIIIGLMFVLFLLIIIGESNQQRINWFPSYSVRHKIPFGTYIAHNEAQKLWGTRLRDVKKSAYVFLKEHPEAQGTYLIYNPAVYLGKTNLNTLFDWVAQGNNLFISAEYFDEELLDSLALKTELFLNKDFEKKLLYHHLQSPLKADTAVNDRTPWGYFFKRDKKAPKIVPFKVLGEFVEKGKDSLYNFIEIERGKGKIFLHTLPFAFTNYAILKSPSDKRYFEGLLAYLNLKKPVYWDIHSQTGEERGYIFQYLLENKAFLWAYRLTFIGLFLYILFEGKRKQRPIPIVTPPKNETLDFTKTIADMYIQHGENKKIALIHIKHFMDYVRTRLHLNTRKWDKELMRQIAQKTKTDKKTIYGLFALIDQIQRAKEIKSEKVIELEKRINKIIR